MNFSSNVYVKQCSILEGSSLSIVRFSSNVYVVNQIIVCFLNGLLTVATVFLNGVAVLTIYKCLHLKTKVCYFLVCLQSGIDLTTGVLSIPMFTYVLASEIAGTANCTLNFIISRVAFVPMALSLAMLCGLSFERYMGVLHPLAHHTKITKKRFVGYVGLATLMSFVMMFMSIAYETLYFVFGPINICISLALTTFVYTRIFLAARKRFFSDNRIGITVVELEPSERKKKQKFIGEFKLAKSCFLMIITFVLCYLPVSIVTVLTPVVSREMVPKFRLFQSWCITLALCNHSLNSVIFFWTRLMLKREATKVMQDIGRRILVV